MQHLLHGGNIWRLARQFNCKPDEILDFSASINPLGPPSWLTATIQDQIPFLRHYPDPDCTALLRAASRHYHVPLDCLVADNGSAEILQRLPFLLNTEQAVIPVPAYADYQRVSDLYGLAVRHLILQSDQGFQLALEQLQSSLTRPSVVFLGHPNNPTGQPLDAGALRVLARENPRCWFIIDEAFADFIPGMDRLARERPENVIVLLSLTKMYALPGLRLGLAIMPPDLARRYQGLCPAWSVNALAQNAGVHCLNDAGFARQTHNSIPEFRAEFAHELNGQGVLHVVSGQANFLLCRSMDARRDAAWLADKLLQQRIAVRVCANFAGLDSSFVRIAVRLPEENARFCQALADIVRPGLKPASKRTSKPKSRNAKRIRPALMFQGTCSSAGKSLLTAALCRILRQEGFSSAPFKAQNMALNSGVTPDGGEIGRAQILQAQACGLEADRRMNPILLKPNSETGSQVIVLGRAQGNMDVGAYIRAKRQLQGTVHAAYDSLAAEHDIMVLEGAGSPAEINLKAHDLVNMAMARHAHAAVLLVGDIDRGGVFAALSGTMDLLEDWERSLVRGLVINKFRGRRSLLEPGLDWIQERTNRPVLGVVPYMPSLGLPEEDSVTFKQGRMYSEARHAAALDVACLDLPHISNFTDLDPLAAETDVALRLVRKPEDLGQPDLLILPGSKNVITDLEFLCQTGLAKAIQRLAGMHRTRIIGICGGYQMLGVMIEDPLGVESSSARSVAGLGLLPVRTVLAREKILRRTRATHCWSGLNVYGYEIHHGHTEPVDETDTALVCSLHTADGRALGHGLRDAMVWGSYLHGIFDDATFRRCLLNELSGGGEKYSDPGGPGWDLEAGLDRLADGVRAHLDIERILRIMGVR